MFIEDFPLRRVWLFHYYRNAKGHNYLRCTKRKILVREIRERGRHHFSNKEEIKKFLCLPLGQTPQSIFENEKLKLQGKLFRPKSENGLVEIETKLDRLLDLQLDGNLSQAEYTAKKYKLILAKRIWKKKIHAFGRKSNNRFELAIAFLRRRQPAEKYAQQENPERIRDFLKRWFELPHCRADAFVPPQKCLDSRGKYHAEAQPPIPSILLKNFYQFGRCQRVKYPTSVVC